MSPTFRLALVVSVVTVGACNRSVERATAPLFQVTYNSVRIEAVSGPGDYLAKAACAGYYAKALSGGFPPVWEQEAQMDWSTPTLPTQFLNFDGLSPAKTTTSHRSGDIVTICGKNDGFGEVSVGFETFYIDVGAAAASVDINGPATLHDVDPPSHDYTAWVVDPYGRGGDRTSKATWSSSNPAVASIDASGGVVPHAKGTFILTGTVYGKSDQGTVTVVGPTTVSISPSNPGVLETKTIALTATSRYADGFQTTAKPAVWTSANQSIATVGSSSGVVTGVHYGQTTITATVDNTITASVTITVSTAGKISGYYTTSVSGAPTPITAPGTYAMTATTSTAGTPPVTFKWEVTYSNGVLPPQNSGFIATAYQLQVPDGDYKITLTVTPKQALGEGYATNFTYPVCTSAGGGGGIPVANVLPASRAQGGATVQPVKRPGIDPDAGQQVVAGCNKPPLQ